jgi:hypothetical protein
MIDRKKIWDKQSISSLEKLVLLFMIDNSNEDGIYTGLRQTITYKCGLSGATAIGKITASLSKKGYLQIIDNGNAQIGTKLPNSYRVTL